MGMRRIFSGIVLCSLLCVSSVTFGEGGSKYCWFVCAFGFKRDIARAPA